MTEKSSPIIQISALLKLRKSENLVLIDATNGPNAKENYTHKHLEDALFVNLNTQLAKIEEDLAIGGRHPLPKIEAFSKTLGQLGISPDSHVVIYDHNNGANSAARFWWMLKSIGHDKVQVLNGGIQEAEKSGFPTSSDTEKINEISPYKIESWKLPIALIDEVENVSHNENHIVIDVRDTPRYLGKNEPIDLIAGHIPGAINIPFKENLDENGLFLSPELLREKYEALFKNIDTNNIIVHCGSGVTACHSLLAITYAGIKTPKLYVGSWSEWSRNNKPIATNEG